MEHDERTCYGICPLCGPPHFSPEQRKARTDELVATLLSPSGDQDDYQITPELAREIADGIWDTCACYDCNPGRRELWNAP
jgi:hypothetical protein